MLAGGLPMDFPTISVHESFSQPTSMYLRNLMSMDTEEMIRAQPMDAVVLIGGCDKTVPAQLMGAASAGVPAIQLVTGSMLTGSHRGERVGACTDAAATGAATAPREIDAEEIADVNNQLVASVGTCSVMGTASTMACLTEALGMMVAGGASARPSPPTACAWPAPGASAVALARSRLTPDRIITGKSIENALRVLLAIGGSTNGIVHLTAIAGRLGIDIDLAGLDRRAARRRCWWTLPRASTTWKTSTTPAACFALRELRPLHPGRANGLGPHAGRELDDAPAPFPRT